MSLLRWFPLKSYFHSHKHPRQQTRQQIYLTSSKVALNVNSHARLLRHGKANLCKKKLLYIVKYSLTLWLSLMLFWFVCVNTQKWLFVQNYAFLRRCCWCVWMAWSALRMQENCILRALNFKFPWGNIPQTPLVNLVQITHVKSWIHPWLP